MPGTPWPGSKMHNHKMQSFRAARDGSLEPQTPGTPQGGTAQEGTPQARTPDADSPAGKAAAAESALAALLSVAKRKLDDAVQMAVASALLGLDLVEVRVRGEQARVVPRDGGMELRGRRRRAALRARRKTPRRRVVRRRYS